MRANPLLCLSVAILCGAGCVSSTEWKKRQIHQAHLDVATTKLSEDKPYVALANFNAALKHKDGSAKTYRLRQLAVQQVLDAELKRARQVVDQEGLEVLRLLTALRGSAPLGIHINGPGLKDLKVKAARSAWGRIDALVTSKKFFPALVQARAVAATMPDDTSATARLEEIGRLASAHHRDLAKSFALVRGVTEFHAGLAELFATPLAGLRNNIHETQRDRPNLSASVERIGGNACSEILLAVQKELRAATTQMVKVGFSLGFCPVGGVPRDRQESYTYWDQTPYTVDGYTYEAEESGSLGGQTKTCVVRTGNICRAQGVVAGSGGSLMKTYKLVKRPAKIVKYKHVKRTGTRTVRYTQYNAGAIGAATVSVAGITQRIEVKVAGTSDETREEAVRQVAQAIVKNVAGVSHSLASRLASELRRKASAATHPMGREQGLILALAVMGEGKDAFLHERYGVDGIVVRDILEKQRRWPPIGIPKMVALPEAGKTQTERDVERGLLRPPATLDENTGTQAWAALQVRQTYLRDAEQINAIALGFKGEGASLWASLGLSAFGGDASSFEAGTETRFRGYLVSAIAGAYFGLELAKTPEDEMLERPVFAGLGPILGVQLNLWRLDLTSRLLPNVFQLLGGTGDDDGTSRPTPWLNSARLNLPFGLFAEAGGGAYLGMDAWVWNFSAGWHLDIDDKRP